MTADAAKDEITKCPQCGCCGLKPHCHRGCGWLNCSCATHGLTKVVYRRRDMHLSGSPTPWGKELG